MTKEKVKITQFISAKQAEMLKKLSQMSMKPQSVLVREAIDLLFKSPGGNTK